MRLYEVLKGVATTDLEDFEISDVTSDTRKDFLAGALFVCIKGMNFDPHLLADEILNKGAYCVVVERDLGLKNQIIVDDTRESYSKICANWFSNPQNKLKIIGVTGTNGKTTITSILKQVLTKLDYKIGLMGTRQNEIGDMIFPTDRSTPEPFEYFELLSKMVDEKCDYVVIEATSQGLVQKRVGDTEFEIGIFTNLTQDHLNVHGTMENYYQAKKLLFNKSRRALINIDDDYGKRFFEEISCDRKSFSIENGADYYADAIKLFQNKSTFWFSDGEKTNFVETKMTGQFNVSNLTAVLACCEMIGIKAADTVDIIKEISGVRGRAEIITSDKGITVMCDYAHTPDALDNILFTVKAYAKGRVVSLFGCTGNRDAKKRPIMAEIAANHSDFVIITSDDPHDENPESIISDVEVGIKGKNVPYICITDRREAIIYAIKNSQKDDIIVLAGKGHEVYQIFENERKVYFNETEIVAEAMKDI